MLAVQQEVVFAKLWHTKKDWLPTTDCGWIYNAFCFVKLLIRQKSPPNARLHPAKTKVPARNASEYHWWSSPPTTKQQPKIIRNVPAAMSSSLETCFCRDVVVLSCCCCFMSQYATIRPDAIIGNRYQSSNGNVQEGHKNQTMPHPTPQTWQSDNKLQQNQPWLSDMLLLLRIAAMIDIADTPVQ